MALTNEQIEARDREGKNIIVSAGAGSGKTEVLTQRILRKLTEGVHINELLILTFTNAASAEMKDRIRKKIIETPSLKEELNLIDSSYISTFDSFTLSILKKYNYLLNISSDISPCEESLISLKKKEILDNIFDSLYEKKDEKLSKLINDFCVKDDNSIRDSILKMNSIIERRTDKYEYLSNYIDINYSEDKINENIKLYEEVLLRKVSEISDLLEEVRLYADNDFYEKLLEALNKLFNAKTYDEMLYAFVDKLPQVPPRSSEELKAAKKELTDTYNEFKKSFKYKSTDEIKEYILNTKDYVEIIIDIITRLNKELDEFKFKNDLYTFGDIAILAINLVKSNEKVRKELKNSFKEIMIDEYQDTDDLEEELVSLISDNNVYMVGDIKQSIYRFRNANPDNFKEKYDLYKDGELGYKIDLSNNFRSREEVVNNVNLIFDLIMDKEIGGSNYIEDGRMNPGNKDYNEKGKVSYDNNMEIINYNSKDSKFSKEEIEAFIIANDIKNKIDNKYLVYDKKDKQLREAKYSDFVILARRSKNFELFKKILEYNGIPLTIEADVTIKEDASLIILKNLLLLVTNIYNKNYDCNFKHQFISIMRSPLIDETDENIFKYFVNNNFSDSELFKKCEELSKKMTSLSTREFIILLLDEFDFYHNLIKLGDVDESIVKIEYLIKSLDNFNKIGYTVIDFSNYLDEIMNGKHDIKLNINKDIIDSVKIMTIHKSKGLEFSVCYYPELYPKFNIQDLSDRFIYNKKYGFITPIFDDGIDTTILKDIYSDYYYKEEISEEIRLFYVALTRAKEKMIFLVDDFTDGNIVKENKVISNKVRNSYNSFRDILKSIRENISPYIKDIDINELNISRDYNLIKNFNYKEFINLQEVENDIKEINISNKLLEEESYSKKENKLITKEEKDNMEYGTKVHHILECLDFINPDYSNIDNSIKNMITKFLDTDLLKNINEGKIYKEYEFMYEKDNTLNHGIIDLMIEYSDYIDIIDYKLKKISDENYIKQLKGYKEYIEERTNKKVNLYLYSLIDNKYELIS